MMNAELKTVGGNLVGRHEARCTSAHRGYQKPGRFTPAPSLRLPVTPENRGRLRVLRQAEMRAWNLASHSGANAALRSEVTGATRGNQTEFRLFAGVVLTAAVALALGLLASIHFVQDHAGFVTLVRHLLGVG